MLPIRYIGGVSMFWAMKVPCFSAQAESLFPYILLYLVWRHQPIVASEIETPNEIVSYANLCYLCKKV